MCCFIAVVRWQATWQTANAMILKLWGCCHGGAGLVLTMALIQILNILCTKLKSQCYCKLKSKNKSRMHTLGLLVTAMTARHGNKSLRWAVCVVNFNWELMGETLIWQRTWERWSNWLKGILKSIARSRHVTRQRQMCRPERRKGRWMKGWWEKAHTHTFYTQSTHVEKTCSHLDAVAGKESFWRWDFRIFDKNVIYQVCFFRKRTYTPNSGFSFPSFHHFTELRAFFFLFYLTENRKKKSFSFVLPYLGTFLTSR